jgi:uncharacterized protein YdhG (YjbR/CyaY superfamily)
MEKQPKTIDDYIRNFPPETQAILQELRKAVRQAAPEAEETISYQMPAFRLNGILVYFAAAKKHIGFYPTGSAVDAFKGEIEQYRWSKGTIRFPMDQPLPLDLVKRIVEFRVKENLQKKRR